MKVVHCMLDDYDVYIGRGKCPKTGRLSKWSNPYSHNENSIAKNIVASREEALIEYRNYILNNKILFNRLCELKDKTLGCWCKTRKKPKRCHGDILIELVGKYCKDN